MSFINVGGQEYEVATSFQEGGTAKYKEVLQRKKNPRPGFIERRVAIVPR